ncbi:MAG TPA: hypothetical protein DET40_08385 [Lentisphaeria bacterium]|nr:MAG: hypothetical protein A2X45_25900 [Lentisphaerae bacterium GWF2_50_93]HCE43551.1 hypothetical protein [Lentisphaeria bacterium]
MNIKNAKLVLTIIMLAVFYAGCATAKKDSAQVPPAPVVEADQPQTLTKQVNEMMKSFESNDSILPPLESSSKKDAAPYTLYTGDLLEISVLEEPEMTRDVSVLPDGTITYLLVGEIKAKGKTIKDVRLELEKALTEYFVKPRVSIIIKKVHEEALDAFVSMMGALKNPGKFKLSKDERLTDAVADAGGLLYINDFMGGRSVANLNASYISRDGVKLDVDFDKLFRLGDMRFDIPLESGDFIYIGEADTNAIIVLGEVTTPQIIPHNRDISLVEAISRCGGFTEKGCKSEVIVLKASPDAEVKCVKINLEALLAGTGKDKNILIEGGDIVWVPEQGMSEYARYAGYLLVFAELVLKAYNVRDQIRFPQIHRYDTNFY